MIHQELCPVPELTVAENIFLGREPRYPCTWWVDGRRMIRDAGELFKQLGVSIDPRGKMKELSVANTQIVEIAKALSYNSSLIIMDEPTSALSEKEASRLLTVVRSIRDRGASVIYISHKLDEILSISDQITVLRDGRYIDTVATEEVDRERLIEMMVGRQLDQLFPKNDVPLGPVRFEVKNVSRNGAFRDVSFQVHGGEILGVAGLMGAGRTEIVEAIFGLPPPDSGEILINGQRVVRMCPQVAIERGMALLTEDRKLSGLFLPLDVRANMSIASLDRFQGRVLIDHRSVDEECQAQVEALGIKTPGLRETVRNLSGGNQQKVLIARWLLTEPDILLLDEPTRGIDVGGKAEIHRWISRLAAAGKAIVMVSSEMPEILGISDRIVVIHEGRISGVLTRAAATQQRIMRLAMGLEPTETES
jgi:inositol transport system ATP-binding protein